MTLQVDSETLGLLYGPRMKLVVAAADAARARELSGPGGDDPAEPELVLFQPATDRDPARVRTPDTPEPADLAPLPAPPSGLCVVAALSPQGRTHLKELLAWWREHGAAAPPPLLDLAGAAGDGPAQQTALYRQLARAALQEVTRGAQRECELTGQLYEMRLEQEQGRVALEGMQGLLARLEKMPCQLAFQSSPGAGAYRPEATGHVRQRLPVGAEGLAGIDLHSPPWPERAESEGTLVVTLRSRERDAALGTWALSYKDLGGGWVRCSLPAALTQPLHHLEIDVTWNTARGTPPPLSLAEAGPWHELYAAAGGRPLGKALALLVWAAAPGAKVGLARAAWMPAEGPATKGYWSEYRVTPDDLARIRPTTPDSVRALAVLNESSFRLHPLGPTPVCAVLPRLCVPGTARLTAVGQINHELARATVEYAMCLTDSAAGCATLPAEPEKDSCVLGFSGWLAVPPDRLPHAVVLELARPLEVQADLHFATRILGVPPDWHWADWSDLRVGLRYGAGTDEGRSSGHPEE
jgi:hypothetical protein